MKNLFIPVVEEIKQHKHFKELIQDVHKVERDELLRWAKGFIDRDNKFIKEFQTTFNSSFWEIYLFSLIKEMNGRVDFSFSAPDFVASIGDTLFTIEATIAAEPCGDRPEWDRGLQEKPPKVFYEMNVKSIIRLSNSITSKLLKFKNRYSKLEHVKNKPFILAVAPFEQVFTSIQYNTPLVALLYDQYLDEDSYSKSPDKYPNGPQYRSISPIEKPNGTEIELGFFTTPKFSDISAIILNTAASWAKVSVMADGYMEKIVDSLWFTDEGPIKRSVKVSEYNETIFDGLQVFHNPFAKHPIAKHVFDYPGVVQVFGDKEKKIFNIDSSGPHLVHRQVTTFLRDK